MIDKKVEITLGDYTMDITPILNAIIKFVTAILNNYLPDDVKGAFEEIEE